MKTSVSSYSFSRLMAAGEITQFGCIAKAKEMGFDGIEFVDIIPHDGSTVEEYAKKLNEEAKRLGLEVTNYTFWADFLNGSNGDTKAEIERVKKQIDIAVLVGAKSVRHDATSGYNLANHAYVGFDNVVNIIADACREVTIYAESKGVKTMVENHGFFCQDSSRVVKLVNKVNHKNFGLLCDMGNYLCVDENSCDALSQTAPYAFYAHAKDFIVKSGSGSNPGEGFFTTRGGNFVRGTIIGHGDVPIKQSLRILKCAGYDGFVAIEFEGMEDVLNGIRIGLDNLKRYISEI